MKWGKARVHLKPLQFQLFTNHGMIQRGNDNIYLKSHDIQSVAISVTLKYSHSYQYLSKHKGEVVGCLACVWAILFLTWPNFLFEAYTAYVFSKLCKLISFQIKI